MSKSQLSLAMGVLLLFSLNVNSFAQTISGIVKETDTGLPLTGATLTVEGTVTGTTTDGEGWFELSASPGDVILVSYIGFTTERFTVQPDQKLYEISMVQDRFLLSEVVVTGALGLERPSREMGGSAEIVRSAELNRGRTINPLTGLQGKVSGLRINVFDSKVDPEIRIRLRGTRSLTRISSNSMDGRDPNDPIYVVDGMPVPSISRLNPNDVESITVLKGANAAALYGSEGVNGAIMITTKSGYPGQSEVNFSHTTTFSNVYMLPPRQTTYGQGNDGVYSPTQYESWGPAFDGSMRDFGLPLPDGTRPQIRYAAPSHDVRKDLFNTGVNSQNDISFAGGSENSTYFLSAQYVTQKGIIPEDTNDRVNLRFNGTRAFGNLDTKYNINFVNNRKDITPDGPWVGAYQYPANFNHNLIRDWENPDSPGNPHNYFTSARSWYRNPYFMIDNIRNESSENIINGLVELNYNFTDWFSAIYRIGLFSSSENYRNFTRKFEAEGTRNVDGSLTDGTSSYSKLNSDLILRFSQNFGRVSTNLLLGQNVRSDYRKRTSLGTDQLLYPDVLNPDSRSGNLDGSVTIQEFRSMAVYGELTTGFDDYLYLTLTGRNDWVSTLSPDNRSYFYPGVSLSLILTDAIPQLRDFRPLSFAKLYGSWNKTGNVTLSPYQLNNSYTQNNGFPYDGLTGFYPGLSNPNPNIKPEFVTSWEVGLETSFFDHRLHLGATYVYSDSDGQIFDASTSRATGYNSALVNAGRMTNDIIELNLSGDIIRNQNLQWNAGFNFAYTYNVVRELYEGLQIRQNFRQSFIVLGEQFPSLMVSDYKRDPQGRVVVGENGDPVKAIDNTLLGTLVPPYTMGINSRFHYKGFSVNAQFDWRMGGWFYSEVIPRMYTAGTHPETARYNREPFIWPNSVIEVEEGVYVENKDRYTSGGGKAFWSAQGDIQRNTAAPSDFFKLRELAISYSLPASWLIDSPFREVKVGIVGTNLFMITHPDNDFADPEYMYNQTDGYVSFRHIPPMRNFGFNIHMKF